MVSTRNFSGLAPLVWTKSMPAAAVPFVNVTDGATVVAATRGERVVAVPAATTTARAADSVAALIAPTAPREARPAALPRIGGRPHHCPGCAPVGDRRPPVVAT